MSTSTRSFPANVFAYSDDFWLVVQKLHRSCQKEPARHGFKRNVITAQYPNLCQFFDNYFYNIPSINKEFKSKIGHDFLSWRKSTLGRDQLETALRMNLTIQEDFGQTILKYCRENLVAITVFISHPFVTVYLTDVVNNYLVILIDCFFFQPIIKAFSICHLNR